MLHHSLIIHCHAVMQLVIVRITETGPIIARSFVSLVLSVYKVAGHSVCAVIVSLVRRYCKKLVVTQWA